MIYSIQFNVYIHHQEGIVGAARGDDDRRRGRRFFASRGVDSLPKGYRTRLCKHWLASGGTHCPMTARGLQCKFAHGEHELRPPEEGFAPPPEAKKRRPRRKSSPRPAAAQNIPS